MIGWLIFAGYVATSAVTSRSLLRIVMSRPICTEHREGWFTGHCFSSYHGSVFDDRKREATRVPMGELMERPLGIGLLATLAGLAWPLTGLVVITMHARPTPDEMARRNAEMADTIRDLERQISKT